MSRKPFRKMTILVAALVAFVAVGLAGPQARASEDKTIFYNLSTDETWRAGMALGQANKALEEGYKVVVLLNVRGIYVAARDREQDTMAPTGKTPQDLLKGALDKGARVIVCPMCLKRTSLKMDDLIDGLEMAGPKVTFPLMTAEDTTVVSY